MSSIVPAPAGKKFDTGEEQLMTSEDEAAVNGCTVNEAFLGSLPNNDTQKGFEKQQSSRLNAIERERVTPFGMKEDSIQMSQAPVRVSGEGRISVKPQ